MSEQEAKDQERKAGMSPVEPDDIDDGPESLLGEFWLFMKENKKWWLIPLIGMFLLLAGLVWLVGGGSALSAFIYPLV